MSTSIPALIDDEATLNQLTMSPTPSRRKSKQQQQQQQQQQQSNSTIEAQTQHIPPLSLTLNSFQSLTQRFIEDISSPFCKSSHSQFWNELVSSAKTLGFNYSETNNGNAFEKKEADSFHGSSDSSTVNFDSKEGKSHLDAVVSLLGVSMDTAKFLTSNVLERIKEGSSSSNRNESSPPNKENSLIGTKKLLLLVRDYHYQQQISRIRFVTESLRHEAASNGNEKVQSSCITFLDTFDQRTTIDDAKRGLFKILLSISCAPVRKLQRDEWYNCLSLSGVTSISNSGADDSLHPKSIFHSSVKSNASNESRESQNYFCKDLNERHEMHYGSILRTEALEAMFMLLYNRIDGGISRSDYILLLLAFDQQEFFVRGGGGSGDTPQQQTTLRNSFAFKHAKRQSQLVALILAECMSLWHAIKCSQMSESSNEWIDTHPFFGHGDHPSILNELKTIGHLLLQKFATQAEVRIQRNFEATNKNYIINNDGDSKHHQDDDIRSNGNDNVPESIAILTFGVLIKLGQNSSSEPNWLMEAEMVDISSKCVSVANDVIGAFDYLQTAVRDFLTTPTRMKKVYDSRNNFAVEEKSYEFTLLLKEERLEEIDSIRPEYDPVIEEEDESIVSYASIGREILVGTLTAFRGSITTSTSLETITMLCNLASMIYRNDEQMCSQFWSDWSTISVESSDDIEDPMNQLLYVSYQIATEAITENVFATNESAATVRSCMSALPTLRPFLQFFSSLTTHDGNYMYLQNFLSNGIISASLLGSYYLCTSDEYNNPTIMEEQFHSSGLLEASASVMKSLSSIADMIQEGDIQSVAFLQSALAPSQADYGDERMYGNGCELLHKLASSANKKLLNKNQADLGAQCYISIVGCCLSVMSSLINQSHSEDLKWIGHVTSCLCSEPKLILSSSTSCFADLKLAFFELIHKMSRNTLYLMTAKTITPQSRSDFMKLMNDGANAAFEMILNDVTSTEDSSSMYHSISTLDLLIKHLNIIARAHNDSVIQTNARTLRNSIVDALCSSTKLGCIICNLAVKPTILSPSGLPKQRGHKRAGGDQGNIDAQGSSITQPSHNASALTTGNSANICAASISLLSTWAKVAEHIAIENSMPSQKVTFDDIIEKLQPNIRSTISSELNSISPIRLLFCAAQPLNDVNGNKAGSSHTSDDQNTLLSLLSRYLEWNIEDSSTDINSKYFAYRSLIILDSCLRQFHLVKDNYQYTEQYLRTIGTKVVCTIEYYMSNLEKIKEPKSLAVILYLLDILTSYIKLQPATLNDIVENSQEGKLIDNLVSNLSIDESSSLNEILFATSCGKFLKQFCEESRKSSMCQKILENLLASETILLSQVHDETNGVILDHISASRNSNVLKVLSYQMDIVTFGFLHGDRKQISRVESMMKLSQDFFQRFCHDLYVIIANGCRDFNRLMASSQIEISIDKLSIPYSSIKTLDGIHHRHFANQMELLQTSEELLASQTQFVTTFRVLFTFFDACSFSEPHEQVIYAVKLYFRLMQNYSLALPVLSSLSHQKVTDHVIDLSKALSGYIVLSLANSMDQPLISPAVILELLMDLSNYSLESIQPSSIDVELYYELRSNTILSAILVLEPLMSNPVVLSTDDRKRFNQSRAKCCRLICDTLEWLCQNMSTSGNESKSTCLLQSCLNCMNLLAQKERDSGGVQDSPFLLTQMYQTHLLDTLRTSNAIPLFIRHLEATSDLVLKSGTRASSSFFDIITAILNLVDSLLQSECRYDVSQLLIDHHFVSSLINNPVLRSASIDPFSADCFRGYAKKQSAQHGMLSSEVEHLEKDPKHGLWCSVLQVIASFASSTKNMGRAVATSSIIDFLKKYETRIDSGLHYFQYAHHQEFSLDIGTKSDHQFGYSISFLSESCDILAIMSQVSSGSHRKHIAALSLQKLMAQFCMHSMYVIRSLSSFLGSISTAREIFTLLNQFESVKDKDEDETLSSLYKKFASHPLLVEGIDKGRYEAFRFAQYANNCCICVTKEEHALSRKIRRGDANFHSQVQNEFLLQIESIASKCLLNALSTASKNHPAASSLILFNAAEANKLNASSLLEPGSIVAIRSKLSCQNETLSKLTNNNHQRFARVLRCNDKMKTFSVSYIHANGSVQEENNLEMSRIEGIEDTTKRMVCFRYEPAKESCDQKQDEHNREKRSGTGLVATIGHLIQILQWCRQCNMEMTQVNHPEGRNILPKQELLRCIAELTMVLIGNDLSLHHEIHLQNLTLSTTKGEKEKIHEQLLSLFNEIEDVPFLQQSKMGLKELVDQSIWNSVVNSQLRSTLVTARARNKEIIQNRDQDHYAYYGSDDTLWSSKLSRRRSPFK